jgi:hypothetical protein
VNPAGRVCADFGFTMAEVFRCTLCGAGKQALAARDVSLVEHSVPISPLCPVAGLVGVCPTCREFLRPGLFHGESYTTGAFFDPRANAYLLTCSRTWRPPPMVQPIPRVPLFVLTRGFCDERRLRRCIRATWARIRGNASQAMVQHWMKGPTREDEDFSEGALRIEALPDWPDVDWPGYYGFTFNDGHAIRLDSAAVKAMPEDIVTTLVAHELAHVFQYARRLEPIEEQAIDIMERWGFRDEEITEWERTAKSRRRVPPTGLGGSAWRRIPSSTTYRCARAATWLNPRSNC